MTGAMQIYTHKSRRASSFPFLPPSRRRRWNAEVRDKLCQKMRIIARVQLRDALIDSDGKSARRAHGNECFFYLGVARGFSVCVYLLTRMRRRIRDHTDFCAFEIFAHAEQIPPRCFFRLQLVSGRVKRTHDNCNWFKEIDYQRLLLPELLCSLQTRFLLDS
jgi:hypothetical protein